MVLHKPRYSQEVVYTHTHTVSVIAQLHCRLVGTFRSSNNNSTTPPQFKSQSQIKTVHNDPFMTSESSSV